MLETDLSPVTWPSLATKHCIQSILIVFMQCNLFFFGLGQESHVHNLYIVGDYKRVDIFFKLMVTYVFNFS